MMSRLSDKMNKGDFVKDKMKDSKSLSQKDDRDMRKDINDIRKDNKDFH